METTFIKLFKSDIKKYSWWYADGSQPISNGGTGVVLDEDNNKRIDMLIQCCGNCGDYGFIDVKQLRHMFSIEKPKKSR